MTTLKVGSSFYKVFMVILFLTSLYQVAAYCADEYQLSKVVLSGDEDDFYGNFYWPYGSAGSAENAFMSWERIDENNVAYYDGYLYFLSRCEREQLDEVGVKDTIQFDLTYDLEEMKVTGSFSLYTVTTMDFDRYQPGEGGDWLNYANPQWHSKSAKEVVCETWMDFNIDGELDPDNPVFFETIIPVDVTFHAKVLRRANPQEGTAEKYEEKTVTENLPVTVNIVMGNYGGSVYPQFGFWSYPGADYTSRPSLSGTFQCSTDPCSTLQVEWKEQPSEPETPTTEEEPISETNTSEPATEGPVILPDSSSTQSPNLSGILLQGAVSAGAGFGLVEMLKRFFGKTSMEQLTPKDLKNLKEKLNKASTGASESEDIIKLKKEDVGTRPARRKKQLERLRKMFHVESVDSFLQWGLPLEKKGWSIQNEINDKYETLRKSKGITHEQEYKEIVKNKPKFLEEVLQKYVYEKTLGKTDLDVTTYLERNTSKEQMKEINQWNEHMHSKQSRDKERAMKSFGKGFAAVDGVLG